jgi:nucleoside-diphosphate-sugar epimerase
MHPSPRFLLVSSLAAREPTLSHYAASKRQGEEILRSDGGDMEWAILRPAAVYGPGDREIAPLLQMMCKGFAPQAAPPTSRFAMIYIDDLTGAIAGLIAQKAWKRPILELHDGKSDGYDWREVAQTVSSLAARPIYCFRVPRGLIRLAAAINVTAARFVGYAPMLTPGKVRELEYPDWTCDNAAVSAISDWCPRITLNEGMKKTLIHLGLIQG